MFYNAAKKLLVSNDLYSVISPMFLVSNQIKCFCVYVGVMWVSLSESMYICVCVIFEIRMLLNVHLDTVNIFHNNFCVM